MQKVPDSEVIVGIPQCCFFFFFYFLAVSWSACFALWLLSSMSFFCHHTHTHTHTHTHIYTHTHWGYSMQDSSKDKWQAFQQSERTVILARNLWPRKAQHTGELLAHWSQWWPNDPFGELERLCKKGRMLQERQHLRLQRSGHSSLTPTAWCNTN